MVQLAPEAVDRYVQRLDLDPAAIRSDAPSYDVLARLQAAHVRHIPFENLSIVGDPTTDEPGPGVSLALDDLFEKLVVAERGGYCFELNGLFTTLLETLGFEVTRVAAMVLGSDGAAETPANHHAIIASLDRDYVVDPGLGRPQMARPTPLDGESTETDAAGVRWRVVETARPRYDRAVQVHPPDGDWTSRYVIDRTPRSLSYFAATNDYFASAPESMWRQLLIVRRRTDTGWIELQDGTLTRLADGEETERAVEPGAVSAVLAREFDLSLPE